MSSEGEVSFRMGFCFWIFNMWGILYCKLGNLGCREERGGGKSR